MALVNNILSFLVAIIILVGIHEFGHFYVARLCGVRVLRFSLGFGKVLLRRYDRQGTEFTLSALPLGGYVKMLDEREADVPSELLPYAFTRKNVWQRMAIVFAGPVANFILAILLFWVLLLQGEKGLIPTIGTIKSDSIAAKAGLIVGQEIVAVDGVDTPTEPIVEKQLVNRLGESGVIKFTVRDPDSGQLHDLSATLDKWLQDAKDPDPLEGLGIEIAYPVKPIVGEISPKSVAELAGFKAGDKLLRVDDISIADWRDWVNYVRSHAGKPISVSLERATTGAADSGQSTQQISLQVTPESFTEKGVSYGRVGMAPQRQVLPDSFFRSYDYSVAGAFVASLKRTWETAGFVFLSVKKLILGEISTKNLSGPISIAKVAGSSAQSGIKSFVGFVALLSVFLGVFNLLPIPVLDGGHLVYLYIEAIRGKPVSEKVQILGFQVGLFLVVSLSMLAMYNDIMRL